MNESGIAVAHFENPRTFDCSPISPTQAKGGLEWATLPTPNCPTQANIGLEWAAPSTPPTQANTGLEWATSSPTQAKIGLEWATPPDWLEETQHHTLDDALKSLKQGVSRRLIGKLPLKPKSGLSGPQHFWQKRYYDFNIRNYPQFVEKLNTFIAIRSGRDCVSVRKTGSGVVSATMPLDAKDEWRSSRRRRESASGRRGGFVQLWNCPTQAKGGLELATLLRAALLETNH